MKRNLIAHYNKGSSDKVYMACIRKEGANWVVIGKWGRRGGSMSSQVKFTTQHEAEAYAEQQNLFHLKIKEGYQDVDSAVYNGGVGRHAPFIRSQLEPEVNEPTDAEVVKPTPQVSKKPAPPPKPEPKDEDLVALCVDIAGLEDRFDEGIEYVFERHADKAMLWVFDKFGEKRECFKERFRLVKAS